MEPARRPPSGGEGGAATTAQYFTVKVEGGKAVQLDKSGTGTLPEIVKAIKDSCEAAGKMESCCLLQKDLITMHAALPLEDDFAPPLLEMPFNCIVFSLGNMRAVITRGDAFVFDNEARDVAGTNAVIPSKELVKQYNKLLEHDHEVVTAKAAHDNLRFQLMMLSALLECTVEFCTNKVVKLTNDVSACVKLGADNSRDEDEEKQLVIKNLDK